jgi:cyanate permease
VLQGSGKQKMQLAQTALGALLSFIFKQSSSSSSSSGALGYIPTKNISIFGPFQDVTTTDRFV